MMRAGTPAAVQPAGTGSSTTLPAAILAQAPISMLPSTLAPAPSSTPRRTLGWRSPRSLPVPPSVTPCSIETPSSTTAVSPITTPVPWSMKMPLPITRAGMDVEAEQRAAAALQEVGERLAALQPQPVRDALGLQGVVALEPQQRVEMRGAGGIALGHRHDVGARRQADGGIGATAPRRRSGGSARPAPRSVPASRAR